MTTPIEKTAQTLIRDLEVITNGNLISVSEFDDLVQNYKGCGFNVALIKAVKNNDESAYLISEGTLMLLEHITGLHFMILRYYNNKFIALKAHERVDLPVVP